MKKFSRGFTLIELLVVIAIIALLSAIILAALGTSRAKGNDAKAQEQLSSLRGAADIYYLAHQNAYVNTSVVTSGTLTGSTPSSCNGSMTNWSNSVFGDTASGAAGIVASLASSTVGLSSMTCNASSTGWSVVINLPSNPPTNPYLCADYTGKLKAEPTATFAANNLCQ